MISKYQKSWCLIRFRFAYIMGTTDMKMPPLTYTYIINTIHGPRMTISFFYNQDVFCFIAHSLNGNRQSQPGPHDIERGYNSIPTSSSVASWAVTGQPFPLNPGSRELQWIRRDEYSDKSLKFASLLVFHTCLEHSVFQSSAW